MAVERVDWCGPAAIELARVGIRRMRSDEALKNDSMQRGELLSTGLNGLSADVAMAILLGRVLDVAEQVTESCPRLVAKLVDRGYQHAMQDVLAGMAADLVTDALDRPRSYSGDKTNEGSESDGAGERADHATQA